MRKIVFLLFAMVFASAALADEKPKQYDMVIVTLLDGRVFDIEIDADSYIYSYTKEVDEKLKAAIRFHCFGSIGYVRQWMKEGMKLSSEELSEIIFDNLPIFPTR